MIRSDMPTAQLLGRPLRIDDSRLDKLVRSPGVEDWRQQARFHESKHAEGCSQKAIQLLIGENSTPNYSNFRLSVEETGESFFSPKIKYLPCQPAPAKTESNSLPLLPLHFNHRITN